MAANSWRHGIDLNRLLAERPQSLEFFQAVRLIEALRPGFAPVGEASARLREPVSFQSASDLRFPPTDIVALDRADAEGEPERMTVAFLGLAGGSGPLPMPFTELLLERLRRRDRAMKAFLDIFNHRLTALFYRAHRAGRPGFAMVPPEGSRHAGHLFSVMGLGLGAARGRLGLQDTALLPYAGLLAHKPRSAVALERTLSSLFALPVRLRPFTGHWHALGAAGVTRLGGMRGVNAVLGRTAVLGTRAWIQDGRAEIVVGPMTKAEFDALLPPFPRHRALASVARLHVGASLDLRLRLRLKGGEIPALRLGQPDGALPGARLGWTSWLGGRPRAADDDQVVVRLAP
jgi:type VI secretion system protein ImpH